MVMNERLGNGKQKSIKRGPQDSKTLGLQWIDELRICFARAYHFTSTLCSDRYVSCDPSSKGILALQTSTAHKSEFPPPALHIWDFGSLQAGWISISPAAPITESTSSPPTAGRRVPSTMLGEARGRCHWIRNAQGQARI